MQIQTSGTRSSSATKCTAVPSVPTTRAALAGPSSSGASTVEAAASRVMLGARLAVSVRPPKRAPRCSPSKMIRTLTTPGTVIAWAMLPIRRLPVTRTCQQDQAPADLAAGVTVREVLAMPAMTGARLLAGGSGLDRVVQRLNVMEVPDILPWVKPHELLLTTGYPLRDDARRRSPALVGGLDERGLAALAHQAHRYLDALPARRCWPRPTGAASRSSQLPDGVGFDDILNQVLTDVLNRQAALLERSEEVHRALVAVVLAGGGLDEWPPSWPRSSAGRCCVTTADGRVLAEAGAADELAALAVVLGASTRPAGSARRRERPGARGRRRPRDRTRSCPSWPAGSTTAGSSRFARDRPMRRRDLHPRTGRHGRRARGDQAAGGHRGREQVPRRLPARRAHRPGRRRGPTWSRHAGSLGWDLDRPVVVVVAELDTGSAPGDRLGLERARCRSGSPRPGRGVVRRHDPAAPVVGFAAEVVALLPVPRRSATPTGGRPPGPRRSPATAAAAGAVRDRGQPGRRRARRAARGVRAGPQGGARRPPAARPGRAVAHFDQLGVFRLLSLIDDSAGAAQLRHRDARATWPPNGDRGGRPAADPADAARHQPQRRRDGAAAALPLQHAALPDREAGATGRAVHDRPDAAAGPGAGAAGAAMGGRRADAEGTGGEDALDWPFPRPERGADDVSVHDVSVLTAARSVAARLGGSARVKPPASATTGRRPWPRLGHTRRARRGWQGARRRAESGAAADMRLAAPAHWSTSTGSTSWARSRRRPTRYGSARSARHADSSTTRRRTPALPLLRQALEHVAHPTIRNRGTTVGSLAHADPAGEMTAVLALLRRHRRRCDAAGVSAAWRRRNSSSGRWSRPSDQASWPSRRSSQTGPP